MERSDIPSSSRFQKV